MEYETFAPLTVLPAVTHGFTLRSLADTKTDEYQAELLQAFGFSPTHYAAAEQTHGNGVAVVRAPVPARLPRVDALITSVRGLPLLIRCADCAPVFIVDQRQPAIGLIHSGKAGTLANVVGAALRAMAAAFGTAPTDCRAVIGPSVGPCHYELDLWHGIEQQLQTAGVSDIHNPRACTACQPARYFSYRAEKGQTGRMLALLAIRER